MIPVSRHAVISAINLPANSKCRRASYKKMKLRKKIIITVTLDQGKLVTTRSVPQMSPDIRMLAFYIHLIFIFFQNSASRKKICWSQRRESCLAGEEECMRDILSTCVLLLDLPKRAQHTVIGSWGKKFLPLLDVCLAADADCRFTFEVMQSAAANVSQFRIFSCLLLARIICL